MNKKAFVKELLNTSDGRFKLTQAMVAPLRRRMDYEGLARNLFASVCSVCQEFTIGDNSTVKRNLEKADIVNGDIVYCICMNCLKETKTRIAELEKNPEELPLYINHSNIFIREFVMERLKEI